MYFRNKNINNSITKNSEKKFKTILQNISGVKSNKFILKKKYKSRNNNIISLFNTTNKYNLFFHTTKNNYNYNNNKENQKLLISKDIKQDNNSKLSISDNLYLTTVNNYKRNNEVKPIDYIQNLKNRITLTDSNIDINKNLYKIKTKINLFNTPIKQKQKNEQMQRKSTSNIYELKRRRLSLNQIHNINFDIRNTLAKNISPKRKSININNKKRYSISSVTDSNLRNRISELIKEMSNNYKTEIRHYKKGDNSIKHKKIEREKVKIKNKTIDFIAKKNRNKFLNLLNKDGSLNFFLKAMKLKTSNNIFKSFSNKENMVIKRPKDTVEMNKLLINSFSLIQDGNVEFSKKLYKLNETFFTIKNEMKIAKAEMELEKLNNKEDDVTTMTDDLIKKLEKNWEKKFILERYNNNKLSEEEFKNFKILNKIQQTKEIIKASQLLADNLMKMDAQEYEVPDSMHEFKSTRSYISNINVHRIRRVKRILKYIEDKEQLGAYDVNVEKLKKNQKRSEAEVMLAIKRSGKPRFVKTKFKTSTISKYKGASGEYFGLPA